MIKAPHPSDEAYELEEGALMTYGSVPFCADGVGKYFQPNLVSCGLCPTPGTLLYLHFVFNPLSSPRTRSPNQEIQIRASVLDKEMRRSCCDPACCCRDLNRPHPFLQIPTTADSKYPIEYSQYRSVLAPNRQQLYFYCLA